MIVIKSVTKFLILIWSLHSLICHLSWVLSYSYLIWRFCNWTPALTPIIEAQPECRKKLYTGTLATQSIASFVHLTVLSCSFHIVSKTERKFHIAEIMSQRNINPQNLFWIWLQVISGSTLCHIVQGVIATSNQPHIVFTKMIMYSLGWMLLLFNNHINSRLLTSKTNDKGFYHLSPYQNSWNIYCYRWEAPTHSLSQPKRGVMNDKSETLRDGKTSVVFWEPNSSWLLDCKILRHHLWKRN